MFWPVPGFAVLFLLAALAFAEPVAQEIVLDDGQVLQGIVEKQEDGSVILTLGSGTMLRFPGAAIREIRDGSAAASGPLPLPGAPSGPLPLPSAPGHTPLLPSGETLTENGWPRDPNRNRYLYSPSAFSLGAGHGYVSQKELVLTEAAFGVTDFWDIQAGTSLVTLVIPGGQVGIVGTKLAFAVGDKFHVGAGGQAIILSGGALLLGFATATYGTEDLHISVNAGAVGITENFAAPSPLVSVSGNWRVGPKMSLLSENWFLLGGDLSFTGAGVSVVPSFAVRLFGPNFATDLGLVPVLTGDSTTPLIPIPWVGFTYNFALPYAK